MQVGGKAACGTLEGGSMNTQWRDGGKGRPVTILIRIPTNSGRIQEAPLQTSYFEDPDSLFKKLWCGSLEHQKKGGPATRLGLKNHKKGKKLLPSTTLEGKEAGLSRRQKKLVKDKVQARTVRIELGGSDVPFLKARVSRTI